jgi:hypothetical protein
MVSRQIKQHVKLFEHKLDSVRKEREHMILMLDRTVNSLFKATVKQYGSQANSLAVDSSDVDLAVTGFNLGNNQSQFIWMGRLFTQLQSLSVL